MLKFKFSKKATFIIIAFVIISFGFVFLVYLPRKDKLEETKERLESIQDELKDMEDLLSRGVSLSDVVDASKEKIEFLEEKFPSSEEAAITGISKVASKYQMSILSINSSVKDIDPKAEFDASIPEKEVKKAYLDILLLGDYINFGEFLRELREDFQNLVVLNNFSINKSSTPGELRIRISLSLYLMV